MHKIHLSGLGKTHLTCGLWQTKARKETTKHEDVTCQRCIKIIAETKIDVIPKSKPQTTQENNDALACASGGSIQSEYKEKEN